MKETPHICAQLLRKLFSLFFISFMVDPVPFLVSENQMPAKVHIVISIEKQIMSVLRNRLPFLDRTSQTQDMEKYHLDRFSV